jgi:hypothetical protein
MNAYRWLHQNDLDAMLDLVYAPNQQRLWRLWLAACLRWVIERRSPEFGEKHLQMVDRLEQVADQTLPMLQLAASRATLTEDGPFSMALRTAQSMTLTRREVDDTLIGLRMCVLLDRNVRTDPCSEEGNFAAHILHINRTFCDCLREIWGNPFDAGRVRSEWRTHDVRQMAELLYRERDWSQMPYLADALLDAGCDDAIVLAHCAEADHRRGCWLLDGLLGWRKEGGDRA